MSSEVKVRATLLTVNGSILATAQAVNRYILKVTEL